MGFELAKLKEVIEKEVFVTKGAGRIVEQNGTESAWIFDFRKVLMKPQILRSVSTLFLKEFKSAFPFQIGGMEAAAIPLVTGLAMTLYESGHETNAFFIRKSRKKSGLLQMVEGEISDEKVILVDDILNSGKSIIRQVEIMESLGKKVYAVFVILRFRDLPYYTYFTERNIQVISLFTLDDFKESLSVSNLLGKKDLPVPMPFSAKWLFKSEGPDYHYVIPKSAPVLDEERVYFGSDSGNFWAINQSDGSIAWKYRVLFGANKSMIFSSPALFGNTIFFGAHDGNFYALDKETGKRTWVFMEADWIGSSPCVSDKLGLVYVGLEFGLWKKQGGLAALDMKTGKKIWEYPMSSFTHSSPAHSARHDVVMCGCNDNTVYALNAKTGALLWKFETGGEIKASFAFDEKRGLVCFGSFDAHLYVLRIKTGELVYKIPTGEAIYSTPLVYGSHVFVASLDKNLYCVHLETGAVLWKFATNGRIFSSPEVIDGKIYIGSNDGRLYGLDTVTGKNTAFFQATERITNKIAYNKKTQNIFLPTFANEIYCLSRKQEKSGE